MLTLGSSELDKFFHNAKNVEQRVLLLDYDGTLAPFHVERDKSLPYPQVVPLLQSIIAKPNSTVAIISGRAVKDLVPLLSVDPRPEIWGSHGWEHLDRDGQYELVLPDDKVVDKLGEAQKEIEELGLLQQCEIKPVSLAIHWRGLADNMVQEIRQNVMNVWSPLVITGLLEIHDFDGGLELRVVGKNKGHAVREIIQRIHGQKAVAYLGDDLTDEDAYEEVGPYGMTVLVREEVRPTRAKVWIKPPQGLLTFLESWLVVCS